MYRVLTISFLAFLLCLASLKSPAQQLPAGSTPTLQRFQDSLLRLSKAIYTSTNNRDRFEKNAAFVKTLVTALKVKGSFSFGFDSLQTISHVASPDQTFKIFSWFVPTDDGTYRFFGSIQMRTADGSLKLFPLIDGTENIKDTNAITDNKNWYGSRYYEIVPVTSSGKPTCYALLGWKGNNAKTTKKVIEILSFENTGPVFGKPVIEGPKGSVPKSRLIFEYNKLNSMTLKMDKAAGMIVLDHLAPINPDMTGNYEYYASDLSFDGYKLTLGKLKLVENIELKNEPNQKDDLYIDPKRKDIPAKSKF
jgi:hypothetical protein